MKLPYLLLTGKSLRTGWRGRLVRTRAIARDLVTPCPMYEERVGNILAPHCEACQCLFPILPQCDSFLIIVFPVQQIVLLKPV